MLGGTGHLPQRERERERERRALRHTERENERGWSSSVTKTIKVRERVTDTDREEEEDLTANRRGFDRSRLKDCPGKHPRRVFHHTAESKSAAADRQKLTRAG